MKKVIKTLAAILLLSIAQTSITNAQVSINENNADPDPSAMLDVSSSDKGLLVPRMTTEERDAIQNPSEGLMIFNTEDDCFNYYSGEKWYKDCGRDLETDNVIYEPITSTGSSSDTAKDVVFDDSGNAYITGDFRNDLQIGDTTLTSNGAADVYLAKFDRDNNLIWVVQVGSNALDDDPSIAIDHQGNIILTAEFFATLTIGTSSLSPAGGRDILVAKYNSDGVPQWAQQLGFSDVGIEPSVAVDASDNIYLSGYFEGTTAIASTTLSSPSGDYASYIIRMDASGTAQWAQQLEGVDGDVQIYDIAVQGSSVYVAGAIEGTVATIGTDTYTIQGGLDGFFAQYDLNGNYIASSHLISSYYVEAYTIAVDQNGNIFVGGYAFENMDFDGTTFQILGGECLFIAKYDANQDLEWVRYQDQNDDSEINALCVDDEANVIAIGKFDGMMDFGATTVNTVDDDEVFIVKYDTDGNFEWIEKGSSDNSFRDFAYGIGISPQNVIYALGSFVSEVSFSDVSMTGSLGNSDPLIVRLNNEDGSQSFFDNSLAGSQDGDTDASNELQDISLNENSLSISNGSEVDLSNLSLSTAAFSTENGLTQSTNDSDDFLFGATELDNTSGTQQTKFFFDNAQGAFRVGSVLDDNWNQDSLGFASIGLGIDVLATGANTIALGSGTVASGNTSTAIGSSTAASGDFSTALGASTEASGNFSTALGFLTTASGQNSTALGSRTEALSFAEVATGVYNTDYAPNNTTSFDEDDRLFVIGNGESATSKSDALLVYKNGNTEINGLLTVDPNNDDMGYTFPANSPLSGQLLMVNSLGELIWDYNGSVSDERLKENIRILPDALDKLDALNGYYFYWKSSSADTSRQVGVMAQELEQVLPELVHYDSEGYRSVDYASMAAFLIQVNKEQEARINAQQAEIEELKKQTAKINQLEAMLHQLQAQVDNNSTSTSSTEDK